MTVEQKVARWEQQVDGRRVVASLKELLEQGPNQSQALYCLRENVAVAFARLLPAEARGLLADGDGFKAAIDKLDFSVRHPRRVITPKYVIDRTDPSIPDGDAFYGWLTAKIIDGVGDVAREVTRLFDSNGPLLKDQSALTLVHEPSLYVDQFGDEVKHFVYAEVIVNRYATIAARGE